MFFLIKINKFIKISNSNFEFHNKNLGWVILLAFFFKYLLSSSSTFLFVALLLNLMLLTAIFLSQTCLQLIVILFFISLLNIYLIIKLSSDIFLFYLLLLVIIGFYLLYELFLIVIVLIFTFLLKNYGPVCIYSPNFILINDYFITSLLIFESHTENYIIAVNSIFSNYGDILVFFGVLICSVMFVTVKLLKSL